MPEIGVIFGAASGGAGDLLFSTNYGNGDLPWIGTFPAGFNPGPLVKGSTYSFPITGSQPWDVKLTVSVNGQMITGQLYLLNPQPGPLASAVEYTAPQPLAGSHIGFYTYLIVPVTLTDLTVQ
jgi:hypothetical protein